MTPEFQTDGVFDVYKMLDIIRERPKMYFGEESLTILKWFLWSYEFALTCNNVAYHKVGPFHWKFHYLSPNISTSQWDQEIITTLSSNIAPMKSQR